MKFQVSIHNSFNQVERYNYNFVEAISSIGGLANILWLAMKLIMFPFN